MLLVAHVPHALVALEEKYDIPTPLQSALLKFPRANLSRVIESQENIFSINSQKMNDATTCDEMRKTLIKSRETGQILNDLDFTVAIFDRARD